MKAAACGWEDTIEMLLDHGANVDALDNETKAAIDHAATPERGNILKLLTSRGTGRKKVDDNQPCGSSFVGRSCTGESRLVGIENEIGRMLN